MKILALVVPLVLLLVLAGCATRPVGEHCTCGTCAICCSVPPMVEIQMIPTAAAYEPAPVQTPPDCSGRAL